MLMYNPLNDHGFLRDAFNAAKHSKDPSTQVGCVIIRPDRTKASEGFNGFPRGVKDLPARYEDRQVKYALVVHAEQNAIVTAREPLHGYTLYCTHYPCNECAKLIIQAGIKRVVSPPAIMRKTADDPEGTRWKWAHDWSTVLFNEGGVTVEWVPNFDPEK
jgi:dCMP deaminase